MQNMMPQIGGYPGRNMGAPQPNMPQMPQFGPAGGMQPLQFMRQPSNGFDHVAGMGGPFQLRG